MKKLVLGLIAATVVAGLTVLPAAGQQAKSKEAEQCVGGQLDAPVRIDVFSDFQCPACQSFYINTIRQLLATYGRDNKVCVVYHEMPLNQHQYSRPAARYAVAARRVGVEQWIRVADALFVNQMAWSVSGDIDGIIEQALSDEDLARVKENLDNPSINAQIERDAALAREKQVRQTPTFFITANGREEKAVGAVQYDILKRYIDQVLSQ